MTVPIGCDTNDHSLLEDGILQPLVANNVSLYIPMSAIVDTLAPANGNYEALRLAEQLAEAKRSRPALSTTMGDLRVLLAFEAYLKSEIEFGTDKKRSLFSL